MRLRGLADSDLRALLAAVSGAPVSEVRNALIGALPELVGPYLAASGELAAVLMEDLRVEAGRRGVFYAESGAPSVAAGRVEGTARWAVGALVDEGSSASVGSRLSGSVSRMIMDASRDTMLLNGGREQVGFQRMPRPGCCAFCGMLASRPPRMVYKSDASAGATVRYERGGESWTGTATHDDCHCVIVPLYPGSEMAELAGVTRRSFEEKYRQSLTDEDGNLLSSPKAVLAEWRKQHGTR